MNPTTQYPMFFNEAHGAVYQRAQEVAKTRIRPMEEQEEAPNEDIQARLDHQLTDVQRRNSSSVIIDNSGSLETLKISLDQALAKCI